jgi:hypothetical protein
MVRLRGIGEAGLLLAWVQHERDGSWHGLVAWIRQVADRHERKVIEAPAAGLERLEAPVAYRDVPRLMLGLDGAVRTWARPEADP